jgi:hypothetical protein
MFKKLKKYIFIIQYPRLLVLGISILLGILIYKDENNFNFHLILGKLGYFGTFLAGAFFSHGFTLGPAVSALLLATKTQNLFVAGIVATFGAFIGNYIVFKTIKVSYDEEVRSLSEYRLYQWVIEKLDRYTPLFVRSYILPMFAGIISATPLPDEFTAALVHASKNMSFRIFSFFSFVSGAFGIFILLWIGRLIQ